MEGFIGKVFSQRCHNWKFVLHLHEGSDFLEDQDGSAVFFYQDVSAIFF